MSTPPSTLPRPRPSRPETNGSSANSSAKSSSTRRPTDRPAIGFGPATQLATAALALTTIVTAVSYCRIFPDWSFLVAMVAPVVVVHLALAACRWFHLGVLASWALSVAAGVVSVGIFTFSDTLAVIIPTRATWDAAWLMIADSFATFESTVAPVPSEGGYALAATLGLCLVAIVSDTFAFRAFGRVEAVVPAALMFVLAASLGVDRNRLTVTALWLASAILTVALLRSAHNESMIPWLGSGRGARTAAIAGGASALALAAIVGGVVLGPRLPGADSEAIIDTRNRGGGDSTIVSPLVSVQARLVNRTNVELATVRSDRDSYWRLTALSDFDGKSWTLTSAYDDSLTDAFIGTGSETIRQEFTIVELGESFVPAAFSIVDVASTEALGFDAETSTLIRRDKLYTGMSYVVESAIPSFSVDQLRAATVGSDVSDQYLDLPDSFSDELRDLALSITAGQSTPYDQALAMQNWFQSEFTYNVNVPRGNGNRAMESFIRSREGYCEQFSSTFAALARVLGIPSRVVVGFTPGDRDDNGVLHIRGKHAHAWPEVYFDGLGWVPFEPTPGRGAPGAEAWTGRDAQQSGGVLTEAADSVGGDASQSGSDLEGSTPTTRPATLPTIPREPGPAAGSGDPDASSTATAGESDNGGDRPVLIFAGLLILILGALWVTAMPPLARWFDRRRVGPDPAARVTAAWSRSAESLSLLDAGQLDGETPIEHARRAWHIAGVDQKLLTDLAGWATRALYSAETVEPSTAVVSESHAKRIGRLVSRRAPRGRRLAARIDPIRASRLP